MFRPLFMRLVLTYLFVLLLVSSYAQSPTDLSTRIIKASIQMDPEGWNSRKKLAKFSKKGARYNPFNYLGAGFLYAYQAVFSEQIQANCLYETSCSEYTKQAIGKLGFISGTLRGFNQITECFDGALYEHPAIFRTNGKKLINSYAFDTD